MKNKHQLSLLFVLSTDILTQKVNACQDLPGLKLSKTKIKIQQYADDITCILTNDDNIQILNKILNEFSLYSGLHLNPQKCKLLSNSPYMKYRIQTILPDVSLVEK